MSTKSTPIKPTPIKEWQVAYQSHCGKIRKVNEDSVLAQTRPTLLAVADGMGGHQAGDIASQMLINNLAHLTLEPEWATSAAQVYQSILVSNEQIREYSKNQLKGQTVGTTVVAMLSIENAAICYWAGDSRLYRLRNNQLEQLTHDHSYIADLINSGLLRPEDANKHPSANIITRSVGVASPLALEQIRFEVSVQDTFLLCSDGLYNEVDAHELQQAMQAYDIYRGANWLLNLCLGRAARDNVSFIIARPQDQQKDQVSPTLTYFPD